MSSLQFVAFNSFIYFTLLLTILKLSKVFRAKRGALSKDVCLSDFNYLVPLSVILGGSAVFSPQLNITVALATAFYCLLVWLDAMLFVQFRIEVNRQTIRWFFTGSKGLAKGAGYLFAALNKFAYSKVIPFIILLIPGFAIFDASAIHSLPGVVFLTVLRVFASKERLSLVVQLAAIATATGAAMAMTAYLPISDIHISLLFASLFVLVAAIALVLNLFRAVRKPMQSFFTTPSLLPNIVLNDNFSVAPNVDLKDEHAKAIKNLARKQTRSEHFAACKDANIILITMESLGCYIPPFNNEAANSLVASKLAAKSWISEQHFCLCPNTTVSTNQMYSGGYSNNPYNKDDSKFFGTDPLHVETLKRNGYKTLFLDSADIGLYDYWKLLNRIGFDKIWGTDDLPGDKKRGDYRLLEMVDVLADEIADEPFFLHVINDQTHMPYEVIDKERFNRHRGGGQKSLYLNAVEEVDYILDQFLTRLSEKIDLSNTILVFTGDHGESFGEFGYSFHSNSVIAQQVQVPFMLSHPNLQPRTIEHSSHFDLFPTFFDLLGIEYDYQCIGQSLGNQKQTRSYLFHSATLKGNTPANFSFMYNNELFWVDRLFSQTYNLVLNQQDWLHKSGDNQYTEALLAQLLCEQRLIHERE